MTRVVVLSVALWLAVSTAGASNFESLGYSEDTSILPARDPRTGTLAYHHDGSFENGYAWSNFDDLPAPNCAWGEGYDVGPCQVICGAYWLTTLGGYFHGQTADLYIWQGGVTGEPGAVQFVMSGVLFDNIPVWPEIGENDVALGFVVSGEFTIGYWGDWGGPQMEAWFTAIDNDGPVGHPWTYVPPNDGTWPTGWQHPNVVWDFADCRSLGIGLYYDDVPVPVEAPTWGAVKALFRQ